MVDKTKILYLDSIFTKDMLPTAEDAIDSISISGYASTNAVDRVGDVIPASVWEKGMQNYLKNPIILAYHDYDDPVGRMLESKVDDKGLWVKARISAAAEDVFNLVKDGVLTAFSVGFRILDAEYNSAAEVFMVKELELLEISVVAIPCNQDTLFSLSKSFDTETDYKTFKMQFAPNGESAKGLESTTDADSTNSKEFNMTPEEIQKMLDESARNAAALATKSILEAQAKAVADAKAEQEAKDAAEAALDAKIKAAVATVSVGSSGAERLVAELEKRLQENADTTKGVIEGLEASLKDKAQEILAIQKSKMSFSQGGTDADYSDKEKAVFLSKVVGKSIGDTRFGRQLLEKTASSQHLNTMTNGSTWELEVSTQLEAEIRRRLVVAPLFRTINMTTPVMNIPVNPEAGYAGWVTGGLYGTNQYGTSSSTGSNGVHALKDIVLNSYKLATNEYIAYEEEEDSIIALLPLIRDAMVRRTSKSVDKALLVGPASASDPIQGLGSRAAAGLNVTTASSTAVTVANMLDLRKNLSYLGLQSDEVVYIVSTDVYYDLLKDSQFQTLQNVGPEATLITGQIGSIGNIPVIVSGEMPTRASNTTTTSLLNIGALCVYKPNFIVGNQRGVRMDTQDLVETQRRVLVASLRMGFQQIATYASSNSGVAALRFTS